MTSFVQLPSGNSRKNMPGSDHYKTLKIQPGHFSEVNGLTTMSGDAIKYIVRYNMGLRGVEMEHGRGTIKDIDKAIDCLRLIKQWTYD